MPKPIYILGGMGPQASIYFYEKVIRLAEIEYGAKSNDDYPEINIHSVPVPDFISDTSKKGMALSMLAERVRKIDKDFYGSFAIACNTVHLLADELSSETDVKFFSMIDEVVSQATKFTKVGILATPTSLKFNLYQDALTKSGVSFITPNSGQLIDIESAIRAVISNSDLAKHRKQLKNITNEFMDQGAEKIIIGCTELPIVYGEEDDNIINSVSVLVKKLLKVYYR